MSSKEARVCLGSRRGRWTFNNTQKREPQMVRVRVLLTFLFISAWAIPLANAAPATCPSSGTYATLMGLNTAGGCTIDNLLSSFTFASTDTGGATSTRLQCADFSRQPVQSGSPTLELKNVTQILPFQYDCQVSRFILQTIVKDGLDIGFTRR